MWRDMLILAIVFVAFLAAFGWVRWGQLVRTPERRNPWYFLGSGGA
ncbi:MAG: hypothetical protein AABZ64_14550 [Nitrospinota bacterium]